VAAARSSLAAVALDLTDLSDAPAAPLEEDGEGLRLAADQPACHLGWDALHIDPASGWTARWTQEGEQQLTSNKTRHCWPPTGVVLVDHMRLARASGPRAPRLHFGTHADYLAVAAVECPQAEPPFRLALHP
jgi:hypothetical protein